MNTENLGFLQNSLKFLGFGESTLLNQTMETFIGKETPSFELYTEAFYDAETKMEARLYFCRSATSDRYVFQKYDALLRFMEEEDKNRAQTFYLYKGNGVTFKEAYNLLQGRSVNKNFVSMQGERYNAWIKLNFEEKDLNDNHKIRYFRSQYRFDLEKTLEKYPIRELKNDDMRAALIRSLRRGNMHLVTMVKPNKTEKTFIMADPEYKQIQIFSMATRAAKQAAANQVYETESGPDYGDGEPFTETALDEEQEPSARKKAHL
jgi:hypothetical protein